MSTNSISAAGGASNSFNQSSRAIPSAETASLVPKKRPRPTLSCIECRKRKLKCDRLLPCNQCTRLDKVAQCVYQNQESSHPQPNITSDGLESKLGYGRKKLSARTESTSPSAPLDTAPGSLPSPPTYYSQSSGNLEELRSRVLELERKVSANTQSGPQNVPHENSMLRQPSHDDHGENIGFSLPTQKSVLTFKGSRTRYFGPNHKLGLLNRFENVMDFCQRGLPGLSNLMPEFKRFQSAITSKRIAVKDTPALDSSAALSKLLELLPTRTVCDQLITTYFYACEKSIRVIHIPSFLRECQQFWENDASSKIPYDSFVPLLYAVVVVGSCWDESNVLRKHLESHGLTEASISRLIEYWLAGLEWKRHIELSTLRVRCILYMTHVIYPSAPLEKIWSNVGTIVRTAMTMSFHHDPSEFSNISVFEGEQRRRVWATIVEMDLQSSLLLDCPTVIREGEYNCLPPANVDDHQLYEEMTEYPVSNPLDEWTDSTLQIILVNSFPLRLKAISISSKIQGNLSYDAYLELGVQIEDYLDGLPANAKFNPALPVGPGRLNALMNLERYIRRALLCLYRPFVPAVSDDTIFLAGRRACVRNAFTMLDQQDFWDPEVADLKVINSRAYWDAYYQTYRNDVIQAALTVCLEIKALSEASSHEELIGESMHSQVGKRKALTSNWTKARLTRTVENTLRCLLRRLDDPGTDLRDILAISMALQASRLSGNQDTTDSLIIAGVTSVIKTCRQHFYGSENPVLGTLRQPDMNISSHNFPSTPASLGESRDSVIADGPATTLDAISFPLDVDVDMAPFDTDANVEWDWSESWR